MKLMSYDSVDRVLLLKLLAQLGVPPKIISVIREFDDGISVRSIDDTCLKPFDAK